MEIKNHVYLDTVLVIEDCSLADHSNLWVMNVFMFDFCQHANANAQGCM